MSDKSWRYLAIGYGLLYAVFFVIERHGMGRAPMSPLERIFMAPILWGLAIHGLQHGAVRGRFSTVERARRPLAFWLNILFYSLFGLLLFGWGVRDACR